MSHAQSALWFHGVLQFVQSVSRISWIFATNKPPRARSPLLFCPYCMDARGRAREDRARVRENQSDWRTRRTLYLNQCYREIKRRLALCPGWHRPSGAFSLASFIRQSLYNPDITRMTGRRSIWPIVKCSCNAHSPSIFPPRNPIQDTRRYTVCVYRVDGLCMDYVINYVIVTEIV